MKEAIVNGIVVGAVPSLLGVGLVLIYKGSGIFNFAQAEFGSVAGWVAFYLIADRGLPYAVGAVAGVLMGVVMGLVVERLVVRPLANAPRVTLLVATAGVTLFTIHVTLRLVGANAKNLPPAIGGLGPKILGVFISPQKFLVFAVLAGLAVGLAYFFNRTNLGLAVLATSMESTAAELVGISSTRISAFVWGLAGALGGIAGVLQGPIGAITPGYMTRFLLASFAAAVLGGMTSLPGAFLGGEVVGISTSLAAWANTRYFEGKIPGPENVILFGVVLAVLLVRPQGILGQKETARV